MSLTGVRPVEHQDGTQIGDGFLARGAVVGYRFLVLEVVMLVSLVPALVLATVLDRDPSNLPLLVLALLPAGPALSAGVSVLAHPEEIADLATGRRYWRAYRRDALAVLRLWAPLVAGLAVIAFSLAHLDVAGVPAWWGGALVVVAALALVWGMNALVITALFDFRARDVARLAGYLLGRRPLTSLKHLSLLVLLAGTTYLTSDVVPVLLAPLVAAVLLSSSARLRTDITQEFLG